MIDYTELIAKKELATTGGLSSVSQRTYKSRAANVDKPCRIKGCENKRHITKNGKNFTALCTYHFKEYIKNIDFEAGVE